MTYWQPGAHLAPTPVEPAAPASGGLVFQLGAHNLKPEPGPVVLGPLKSWSFSSLHKYESCAYRAWLAQGEKIKEPSGPAAERGTEIHSLFEAFIQGEGDALPPKFMAKDDAMARVLAIRDLYAAGKVEVEQDWAFTLEWEPTGWFAEDTWNRTKLDIFIRESETSGQVLDWKTGKSFGNELKHSEQLLFYTVAAFKRYPELEFVEGHIEYVDEGRRALTKRYTRNEAMIFFPSIHKRALTMTTARAFAPKPSVHNCRWCAYKTMSREDGSPVCPFGVV